MTPAPVMALPPAQRIAAAQQHLLYDRLLLSALLSMGAACLFVGLLWPHFPREPLLEWFALIQTVGALRVGLWYWHRRAKPPPSEAPLWSQHFLVGAVLAAGAWSYGGMVLMPGAGQVSMAILVVTLLAVSSVAVSALSAHMPSLIGFMIVTLSPAGLFLLFSSGPIEQVVGIALLTGCGAMIWTGYQGNLALRKLLETELELSESVMITAQARATAEEANRAKSRFLATMSHEIRTPLNGVIGLTEVLRTTSLSAEQQRQVDLLRRSGAHLLDIVNDILDFSKIEAEQLEVASVPVDLRELIEDLIGPLHARVAMTGVALRVEVPETIPARVVTDPVRLRQILGNFLSNAAKFTERGSICLAVDLLDGKPGDDEALLRFRVIDTGMGIPADRIGRIFDAFTQVDDSFARRAGGTGLGLAICRRLAALLGGEVGAASEPGQGSTFVFTLRMPVRLWRDENPNVTASGRYLAATRLRGRVLLAEDNQINLEVAAAMLDMLGLEHDTAEDGRSAVEKAVSGQYDVILMDCQMPGLDGYQATHLLRQRDVRARNGERIPVVAVTANAFVEDRQRAAGAGMDAFMSKPFQLDQLCGLLARWLPLDDAARQRDGNAAA